jgi:predicted transposase/invertase (TIGR01784 family)
MGEEVVHQPNDKLFRSTFSELQNAAAFFKGYLGADLVAAADWSTLRQQEGRFVDEALAGAESDLLFSVTLHGREAFIYILFEHQSREDRGWRSGSCATW